MKKRLLPICLFLLSCSPVFLVSRSDFEAIPKGARKVIVTVPYSADSLFSSVAKVLSKDGWPVRLEKTAMQINSDGKSIGNGTVLKPVVYIEDNGSSSKAYFSGQWGLDSKGQIAMEVWTGTQNYGFQEVVFMKTGTTKPDVAFQKLVFLAKDIPGGVISYDITTTPTLTEEQKTKLRNRDDMYN